MRKTLTLLHKKYIVTISYGNYILGAGGTDKYILAQQRILHENDYSIVHIFPISMYSIKLKKRYCWGICIDGKYEGWAITEQIVNLLYKLQSCGNQLVSFWIHHLKNSNIDEVRKIISCCEAPIKIMLHDLFCVCPSSGLLRNGSEFCGCDFPSIQKCKGCTSFSRYTLDRSKTTKNLLMEFNQRLTLIAPSQNTKNLFSGAYPDLSKRIVVIPHQLLIGRYLGNRKKISNEDIIKIAFIGYQAPLKGWYEWEKAILQLNNSGCGYKFYQFGKCETHYDFVKEISVDFKNDNSAMIYALREHEIDCGVLWSMWPETYSYTYYEALAANCFIITTDISGNICDQVATNKNGVVIQQPTTLESFLTDEDNLRRLINEFKCSNRFGPEELVDNDKFIDLIRDGESGTIKPANVSLTKKVNCWLLHRVFDFSILINSLRRK